MIPIFSCDTTDHHAHLPRHLAPDKIPHFIAGNFKNSLYPCKGKSKFQIQTLSIYIYIYGWCRPSRFDGGPEWEIVQEKCMWWREMASGVVLFDKITTRLKNLSYGLCIDHCDLVLLARVCAGVTSQMLERESF